MTDFTPDPAACPDAETLARASTRPDPLVHTHLIGCPRCRATWESTNLVRDLGRLLGRERPDAATYDSARYQRVRPPDGSRRRLVMAGATALAVAGLALIGAQLVKGRPGVTTRAPARPVAARTLAPAQIEAAPGTQFRVGGSPPHEVVHLSQGTLRIAIEPQPGVQRSFRLLAPDAEVEVRGTVFETTVLADRLRAVRVERGRVTVRPLSGPEVDLAAGGQWSPPPPPPASDPIAAGPTAGERAFRRGLRALEGDDPRAAARDFARAGALAGEAALAEEAAYWRAIALSRAGDGPGARSALELFLERHPRSPRAGELSVLLGSLLLEQDQPGAARARFEVGLQDPSPRIQRRARQGLEAADTAAAGGGSSL